MLTSYVKKSNTLSVRNVLVAVGLLSLALPTAGCASIVSGSKQEVNLTSHPVSAALTVTTEKGAPVWAGNTPATIELPREKAYIITAEVPGYAPATARIDKSLNGWFIGNLLCGGIIGGIIDYASGAMWKLDPDMVTIDLVAEPHEDQQLGGEKMVLRFRALDEDGQVREAALTLIPQSEVSGA